MILYDIEKLRRELYSLIDSDYYSYDEIYRISVELDKLIIEFYKNQNKYKVV